MEPEEYANLFQVEQRHWWYVGMRGISLALLDTYLPKKQHLDVLDGGCGTGGMMLALARYGRVTGIDFSPLAVGYSRQRGLDRVMRASVTHLPFPNECFDLVTSFEVLYHLGVSDDGQAIQEFARVLRPGGHMLLRLPAFESMRGAHDVAVHTRHRYTTDEVQRKVESAGLQVVRLSYGNTLLFPLAAGTRLLQRLTGRDHEATSDVHETSALANKVLSTVLTTEKHIIPRVRLPFGLSVFCLARKP